MIDRGPNPLGTQRSRRRVRATRQTTDKEHAEKQNRNELDKDTQTGPLLTGPLLTEPPLLPLLEKNGPRIHLDPLLQSPAFRSLPRIPAA